MTECSLDEGVGTVKSESSGACVFRPFEKCQMSGDLNGDAVDGTTEYLLPSPSPSPTYPLGRDDLPL